MFNVRSKDTIRYCLLAEENTNKYKLLTEDVFVSIKQLPLKDNTIYIDNNYYNIVDIIRDLYCNIVILIEPVYLDIEIVKEKEEVEEDKIEYLSEEEMNELIELSKSTTVEYNWQKLCEYGLKKLFEQNKIPSIILKQIPKKYNNLNTFYFIQEMFLSLKNMKENPKDLPVKKDTFAKGVD